ncbi:MAG TPA: hypothetical protein VF043_08420 [Ktedonobacteraceae bacterium]
MEQRNASSNVPPEKPATDQRSVANEKKLAATSPNVQAEKPALDTSSTATTEKQTITSPDVAQERPISESRQAYGTAKTENLQDSGLWRIALPAFVILCCVALLAIPLIILIPLFSNSLMATAESNKAHISLTWLWIVLIILDVSIAAIAIRGLLKIFITQAGNYQS